MSEKDTGFIDEAVTKAVADGQAQHQDEPILTSKEIAEIRKAARDEIMAERKNAAKVELKKAEIQRLKEDEGLVTGNRHADEIVSITIDLPEFAAYIGVNTTRYYHAQTYKVPRHVADSLRSQMYMSWEHQNTIDGKSMAAKIAARHVDELYRIGRNAVPPRNTLSGRAA